MAEMCHYCHETITRHESTTEVWDNDGWRTYHDDCHRLDISAHRQSGARIPEDQEGPPMTGVVWSSGYSSEHCSRCGAPGHLSCSAPRLMPGV